MGTKIKPIFHKGMQYDIEKIKRLAQWCEDATERQKKNVYKMLYVKQEDWDKYKPTSFKQLVGIFSK